MRVFITGASGWIGSALVPELIAAGHRPIGLARSDVSAAALHAAGAEVVRGDITDLEVLRTSAAGADAVVHLAFQHDVAFSGGFAEAADADRRAIEAFADALEGTDRPLAIASGLLGATPGAVLTERMGHEPREDASGPGRRHATAEYTLALAGRGIRSIVIRLAPTNHGEGDNGFMATIVAGARAAGAAAYVGDGAQRWPAVHRLDTARLFRLAIERSPAASTLHAVAEEGVAMRDIAAHIGAGLGLPVRSVTPEEAPRSFSWLAGFVQIDSPASSDLTRAALGWNPSQPGLLADLDAGHYFRA